MMLTDMPVVYAGGGFPWGLLILAGIAYFLWSKGVFDGRGRHGNGPHYGGHDAGYYPAHMPEQPGPAQRGGGFGDPRAMFDEWHRQAHEAERAAAQRPATPQAPSSAPPAAPEAPAARPDQPAE